MLVKWHRHVYWFEINLNWIEKVKGSLDENFPFLLFTVHRLCLVQLFLISIRIFGFKSFSMTFGNRFLSSCFFFFSFSPRITTKKNKMENRTSIESSLFYIFRLFWIFILIACCWTLNAYHKEKRKEEKKQINSNKSFSEMFSFRIAASRLFW